VKDAEVASKSKRGVLDHLAVHLEALQTEDPKVRENEDERGGSKP